MSALFPTMLILAAPVTHDVFDPSAQACAAGNTPACHRLAERALSHPAQNEVARYAASFLAACQKEIADGCAGVGMAEFDGAGLPQDRPKALRDLDAACDAGSSAGCAKVSEYVLRTEHDRSVLEKRFTRMVARCEKLGGSVCFSLALAYNEGLGTDRDSAKGSAMAKRACDTGSSYACLDVATSLSEAGKTAEARTLLLKACDGDIEQACALAGAMTKPADGPEARKLFTRGCALGMPQSCDALAGKDDASRRAACESGGIESCVDLAFKLGNEAERQHKWEQMEETIGLLKQACRRGSTRSCNVLGHVAKDAIRACDADNGPQCLVAAFVHSQGVSMPSVNGPTIPADPNKAKADFARACRLGVKSACGR